MDVLQLATEHLYAAIKGRYVTNKELFTFIDSLNEDFKITTIGKSVLGKEIKSVQIGTGKTKVLLWSQMHGNESTTTKGLFDFLSFLNTSHENALKIKQDYTILCIPILNPDGAELYTRENANKVDLNRDAKNITQPESLVLRTIVTGFQPDFCFNLHDQRTIFGVGNSGLPATMSFLAPSFNEKRDFNSTRMNAIGVINFINNILQKYIPNQVGRFDDGFNDNCIGDYLTTKNIPTILFEAGHYQNDYQRDEVRKFVFISLYGAFSKINENVIVDNNLTHYLNIPQNKSCFRDIIYKNIKILDNNNEKLITFAAQFKEVLTDSVICFEALISDVDISEDFFGHEVIDGQGFEFDSEFGKIPIIGKKADFSLNKTLKFQNGLQLI